MSENENENENDMSQENTSETIAQEDVGAESTDENDINSENESQNDIEKPVLEEEKIEITKAELDARELGIKRVAEKRAYKKAVEELQKFQSQNNVGSNANYWDSYLNRYIPANMTVAEYARLANEAQSNVQHNSQSQSSTMQQQYTQSQQQPQMQQVTPPQREEGLTEQAEQQVVALMAKEPGVQTALTSVPVTDTMVNAIAIDPHGIENLWAAVKERPHEIYRICHLSPMEQQAKMWELNQEFAKKRAPKVLTKAKPQPTPLSDAGNVNKSYADMSYLEKKALLQQTDRRKYPGAGVK